MGQTAEIKDAEASSCTRLAAAMLKGAPPSTMSAGKTVPENSSKAINFSVHSGDTVSAYYLRAENVKFKTRSRSMPLGIHGGTLKLARLRRVNRGAGLRGEHNRYPVSSRIAPAARLVRKGQFRAGDDFLVSARLFWVLRAGL